LVGSIALPKNFVAYTLIIFAASALVKLSPNLASSRVGLVVNPCSKDHAYTDFCNKGSISEGGENQAFSSSGEVCPIYGGRAQRLS